MELFPSLQPGKTYEVKIKGGRTAKRIFKYTEKRFGFVTCHVFTSKITGEVTASYDQATETLTLSGKQLPTSEISIPEYDLLLVREVA